MCAPFLSFLTACLSLSNRDRMRREFVISLIQQDPVPSRSGVCVVQWVSEREREILGQTDSSLRWSSLGSTYTFRPHIEKTIHYKYQSGSGGKRYEWSRRRRRGMMSKMSREREKRHAAQGDDRYLLDDSSVNSAEANLSVLLTVWHLTRFAERKLHRMHVCTSILS